MGPPATNDSPRAPKDAAPAPARQPKPSPLARGQAARFYEAAAEGRIAVGRCGSCGHHFLPRVLCPKCGSTDVGLADVEGRGTVYSFSIAHRSGQPGYEADVPYVVAVVELTCGVKLMTNLPGVPHERVRVGLPVVAVFDEQRDGIAIPQFTEVR